MVCIVEHHLDCCLTVLWVTSYTEALRIHLVVAFLLTSVKRKTMEHCEIHSLWSTCKLWWCFSNYVGDSSIAASCTLLYCFPCEADNICWRFRQKPIKIEICGITTSQTNQYLMRVVSTFWLCFIACPEHNLDIMRRTSSWYSFDHLRD